MKLSNVELAEALDRVLHKGAVLRGDVVISVADVNLLYLDLRVVLSSIDTAMTEEVLAGEKIETGETGRRGNDEAKRRGGEESMSR
jgi:hypothetical protein